MSADKLQLVLGNQLFPAKFYNKKIRIFMCEDYDLCTRVKYHKHKIIFFLASMRHYANEMLDRGFDVKYFKLDRKKKFQDNLKKHVNSLKVKEIICYEIEDLFFEKAIRDLCDNLSIQLTLKKNPMFLNTRESFASYLSGVKKPFMKTFYEAWRKSSNVLMDDGLPEGGKYSFDTENRKKIPKKEHVKRADVLIKPDSVTKEVMKLVDTHFPDHPGDSQKFWLATRRKDALRLMKIFLKDRLEFFGTYEDAIDQRDPFLYHTVLSPYLNIGFITPDELIDNTLSSQAPLNSKEGLIRQIAGWREFMRGIYQNYGEKQYESNFFGHSNKLKSSWYEGTTGILPSDDAIKKTKDLGYAHHIERLMIISNIMLLCEIEPKSVYGWFMEMFVDSSDWVMVPNVFGMGQFSDGGIFATKPYICGSNYILKMSHYKKGPWSEIIDGLYWRFIDKHRDFFSKNYRMAMMVKLLDKMESSKQKKLFHAAKKFLKEQTN